MKSFLKTKLKQVEDRMPGRSVRSLVQAASAMERLEELGSLSSGIHEKGKVELGMDAG